MKQFKPLEKISEEEFEECVCGCNSLTNIRKDTPISERVHYVEGTGQLTPRCYKEIYGPSRTEAIRARIELDDMGIII
ncbi:hypothetical protein FJZ20_02595 [Candidatus Pacearchaeota archaeon]|nr:hypothetical protein [Candidatus Pacearchaeota archaeon]